MNEPAEDTKDSKKASPVAMRNSARLMAVQAVYQMSVNRKEAAFVVDEYLFHRKGEVIDGEELIAPDASLFTNIVLGVTERKEDLIGIIQSNRPQKKDEDSVSSALEPLLMAVALCGVYELLAHKDVDAPIIISTYVDVTKAFFQGNEPGLINGLLDSARKVIRA
jgi:N utilization substance protein B